MAALTLADICLDVQICICMSLHPSDILALRKSCKVFQLCTRQRVVWVAALHRVCLDNTLFLPSFPISDMSDLELEKAAIAPARWIELCDTFEKQYLNGALRPRETRIINDSLVNEIDIPFTKIFIVPGGRYLVVSSYYGISVLDLGCTSSTESVDCTLIASVGLENGSREFIVQATTDGMGLIIFSSGLYQDCFIYEIYPQSETPRLIQIAHLVFGSTSSPSAYLLPDTVIWRDLYPDYFVFRVWNYRLNHSISFSANFDSRSIKVLKVMATKTAVIILGKKSASIWAIPPLLPQPPDFSNYNARNMAPLFTIPFPDSIGLNSERMRWKTISSWYSGSSQPLYFDALCQGKLHRFQIVLKPDLSTASLRVMNASEPTQAIPHNFDHVIFQDYRICEDSLVSCWKHKYFHRLNERWGLYTGSWSTRFAYINSQGGPAAEMLLPVIGRNYVFSLCPASGRFVLVDSSSRLAVLDFF